ncbi:NAD dependent epimerase/dehydratase family protein [Candidatus Erwinia haradaeae]|uniref:NAD dependent epimerase/dehydratase family protein n=1 Tax=Candidatus Erwinia haradaeae TaxID=1922217 RepID=A0A451DCC8_9GAMM|nr:NAD-dependent epimerase [Candidatus Erwinia haradaeae]VFP84083.1 NAD dependent epimerase/dehydratase family protein [Candidatus Erwinia haradaeae]
MKFLVTGVAGFIGFHVTKHLLEDGDEVIGLDNLNNYHQDIHLKMARLKIISDYNNFTFIKEDIANREVIIDLFRVHMVQRVIHLAAQAGVRYSLENPFLYVHANLVGYLNILEGARQYHVEHILYASSSSVYGLNHKMPFSVNDDTTHPLSLYAATKKSNELMSHSYSHLYGIPTTALRFFTVYGPWGRQDMALFKFIQSILLDEAISIYNYGQMERDFTYIDDVVEAIMALHHIIPTIDKEWVAENGQLSSSTAPYRVYNIGRGQPVTLMTYIMALENALGKVATIKMLPRQPGDMIATSADISSLIRVIGFQPLTSVEEGVRRFVKWYQEFYASNIHTS